MANTYVLVHGAWLGGWCWDKVIPYLEAEGHKAIAVDLPGHGKSEEPIADQNMETYTQHVMGILNEQEEPVHLTEAFDQLPKVYVRCSIDAIMLPEMQDNMIAATPCEEVYTIEAGHSPYHSKPKELAEVLCKL